MNILDWISNLFRTKNKTSLSLSDFNTAYADAAGELCFRELAFWAAVNLQSAALGQCEFRTYQGGEEVKGQEYYLWNVQPNKNQNRAEWLHELIAKLYRHNEALVVNIGGELLIADDGFGHDEYATFEDVFRDVTARGFKFGRTFVQSEVLYFKLHSAHMRALADAAHDAYSRLLTYSMTAYQRSRGTKGTFTYDALPTAGTREEEAFNALINEKIGKWLTSDNAALPVGRGQKWEVVQNKTYNNETTRDIRALTDDIQDFTAKAFGIPPALLRGDVQGTSDALQLWLGLSIEPLARLIEAEINRKRNGYTGFIRGDKIEIYTNNIEHHDLLNSAKSFGTLISSGFSPNEVRRICGEQQIDEPWANEHFITKNYAPSTAQEGENTNT